MSTTPTTTSGITLSGGHSHHKAGKRLRHFMLPDGRKVHIALSPEEAESLRQRLTTIKKGEPFDLVVSGSPEHLDALRRAHSHYDEKREMLRAKHGPDYDEFENVRAELDTLSSELHFLTDHAVQLDANFSKYGYSAHLRYATIPTFRCSHNRKRLGVFVLNSQGLMTTILLPAQVLHRLVDSMTQIMKRRTGNPRREMVES
jgi:hypothetical protein